MLNQILMYLMAFGVVLGGMDCLLGYRFGFGAKFEEGFQLLGPVALSMAGIICLVPLIADISQKVITPLFCALRMDPGICGGILAVDSGGYQLAMELAEDSLVGQYAGIVIAATFGCTITFTIPVGMGALEAEDQRDFAAGLLIGLAVLPVSLIVGGLLCGLSFWQIVYQSLPVLMISLGLLYGLVKNSDKTIRRFTAFSRGIRIITTLGLTIGAFQHLTGLKLFPVLTPLKEAMEIICTIGIVLLGCLPLSEIIKRILNRPILWFGRKVGLDAVGTSALLMGVIIAMPALAMMKDTDRRGRIINGAFLVCGASAFSAHLGFTLGVAADMVVPLLLSKLTGAICAVIIAIVITKRTTY